MEQFQHMYKLIPEQEKEKFKVTHLTMDEETIKRERMYAAFRGAESYGEVYGLEAGTYVCLRQNNGSMIMSDTWMEKKTNSEIVKKANGNVLIAGLGIGLIVLPIQEKNNVQSITIIEKEQEIIDMITPYLPKSNKVKIICADIFTWQPEQKYDTIYFDIWPGVCGDDYPETKELHKKYRKSLNKDNPNWFMNSWRRNDMRKRHYDDREWN